MKKIIRIIFYSLLSFFFLIVLLSYSYNQSIKSNLKEIETDVNNKWSEYFLSSTNRMESISVFINSQKRNASDRNEIYQMLEKSLKYREKYKNECNLDFVKSEYDLNKKVIDLFDTAYRNDDKYLPYKKTVMALNDKLNILVEEYNKSVLYYNKYISIFPNFIIAKQNGFKKKKYFSIRYGVQNDDPVIKSKELPKWATGVDTI